jgi:hypothetical protein
MPEEVLFSKFPYLFIGKSNGWSYTSKALSYLGGIFGPNNDTEMRAKENRDV